MFIVADAETLCSGFMSAKLLTVVFYRPLFCDPISCEKSGGKDQNSTVPDATLCSAFVGQRCRQGKQAQPNIDCSWALDQPRFASSLVGASPH